MNKFIIVGCYRSGTTLLNEALFHHPNLTVTFEAFHENAIEGNVKWRKQPFGEIREFIENTFKQYDGFKILYHQLPVDNEAWKHLLNPEIKVIHVIRKNIAETASSFMLCRKNGLWQNRGEFSDVETKITSEEMLDIEPKVLEQKIKLIETKIEQFKRLLNDALIVDYGELVADWDNVIKSVCEFINVPCINLPKTTKKRTKPLKYVLKNYPSHLDYFKGTPYQGFFQKEIPMM